MTLLLSLAGCVWLFLGIWGVTLTMPTKIRDWSSDIANVSTRSYMRGYRDIYYEVGLFYKMVIAYCDHMVKMNIVKVAFREG